MNTSQWVDPASARKTSIASVRSTGSAHSTTRKASTGSAYTQKLPGAEAFPSSVNGQMGPGTDASKWMESEKLPGMQDGGGKFKVDAAAPAIEAHVGTGTDLNNFVELPTQPVKALPAADHTGLVPPANQPDVRQTSTGLMSPALPKQYPPTPVASTHPVQILPAQNDVLDPAAAPFPIPPSHDNNEPAPNTPPPAAPSDASAQAAGFVDPDPNAKSAPAKLKAKGKLVDGGPIEDWVDPEYQSIAAEALKDRRKAERLKKKKEQEEEEDGADEDQSAHYLPDAPASVFEDIDFFRDDVDADSGSGNWFSSLFGGGGGTSDAKVTKIPAVYHKNVYQQAVQERERQRLQAEYEEELKRSQDAILRGYTDVQIPEPPPRLDEEEGFFSDLEEIDDDVISIKSEAAFEDINEIDDGRDIFSKVSNFFGFPTDDELIVLQAEEWEAERRKGTIIAEIKLLREMNWVEAKSKMKPLKLARSHFWYAISEAVQAKVDSQDEWDRFKELLEKEQTNTWVVRVVKDKGDGDPYGPAEPLYNRPEPPRVKPSPLQASQPAAAPPSPFPPPDSLPLPPAAPIAAAPPARQTPLLPPIPPHGSIDAPPSLPPAPIPPVPAPAPVKDPPAPAPAPVSDDPPQVTRAVHPPPAAPAARTLPPPMDRSGTKPKPMTRAEYGDLFDTMAELAEKGLISPQQETIVEDMVAEEDEGVTRAFRVYEANHDELELAKALSFLTGVDGPLSHTPSTQAQPQYQDQMRQGPAVGTPQSENDFVKYGRRLSAEIGGLFGMEPARA